MVVSENKAEPATAIAVMETTATLAREVEITVAIMVAETVEVMLDVIDRNTKTKNI